MKYVLLILLLLVSFIVLIPAMAAHAQQAPLNVNVVSACGTTNGSAYVTGQNRPATMDTTGTMCTKTGTGGGGGAVTAVSGAYVDCALVTLGCTTDSVWGGAGSATDTSILKYIATGVNGSIPAGSALIGKVGIDQTTPGVTNAVVVSAATSGGASSFSEIVPANTTAVVVKGAAGQLYDIELGSNSSTPLSNPIYLKLYNATSATCGTGTPQERYVLTGGNDPVFPVGVSFGTGITMCATGGIADNDTTNPTASTYIITMHFK